MCLQITCDECEETVDFTAEDVFIENSGTYLVEGYPAFYAEGYIICPHCGYEIPYSDSSP